MNNVIYRSGQKIAGMFFAVFAPITAIGVENIPLQSGAIIASNHSSAFDPFVVYATCPRKIMFLAKKELFDHIVVAWLLKNIGAVPVDRQGSATATALTTIRALKQGMPVMLTPEGTRSLTGRILPFKSGFVKLAYQADIPIIPTAIIGAHELWPKYRILPRPGKITIVYDSPLDVTKGIDGKPFDKQMVESISDKIRSRIEALIEGFSIS